MNPLLVIENLNISFKRHQAVRGVSFQVNRNEVLGLVGESGSGKSVTALSLLGLLPKGAQVLSGHVHFEGKDLLNLSEKEFEGVRGKHLSLVLQDPSGSLNPTMRIGNQIAEGLCKHENLTKKMAYVRAIELLQLVGISDPEERMHQYPHELSGGMRQRVLIAISLACHPQLLIADEPTTALDATIQLQILDLLKKIIRERDISILLITHDLGVVANICDRVLVMKEGRIVEEGPVNDVFGKPSHPYTKGLLDADRTIRL